MVKIVEINTQQLQVITTEKVAVTAENWVVVANELPNYDYFFIFTEAFTETELQEIVAKIPSRRAFFYGNQHKQLLESYGHFDVTESYQQAESDLLFFEELCTYFYHGQNAGVLVPNETAIIEAKGAEYQRFGSYQLALTADFGSTWQVAVSWSRHLTNWMKDVNIFGFLVSGEAYKVQLDYQIQGNLQVKFRMITIDHEANIQIKDFYDKTFILDVPKYRTIQFQYLVCGSGTVRLGKTLISRNRGEYGQLLPGDEVLDVSEEEQVYCYEIPGKDSRKLIVSFTGALNHCPKFEYTTLAKYGFPVLLFSDFRERSGCFHLGKAFNTAYEQTVMARIQAALAKYGLTNEDLIINGYSMGSFAALYYGTLLNAGDVIASKPITQLGDVTKDSKIIWQTDGTMIDARYYLTGSLAATDDEKLNNYLWQAVARQTTCNTNFHLFGLTNDELDHGALKKLAQVFTDRKISFELAIHEGYHAERIPEMKQFMHRIIEEKKNE